MRDRIRHTDPASVRQRERARAESWKRRRAAERERYAAARRTTLEELGQLGLDLAPQPQPEITPAMAAVFD